MKKLHSFLACAFVACLTLVLFSSCEKNEENAENAESGFAPKSIAGKTFHWLGVWRPIYCKTSSTCICQGDYYNPSKEGTYSYEKVGDNIAKFQCWWEDGSYTLLLILNFTSPETGWVGSIGSENFVFY